VVEHVRSYLAEIAEEKCWDTSLQRTKPNLVAAARRAKPEIAAGLSIPMDYEHWQIGDRAIVGSIIVILNLAEKKC
jgi:hypothetical protein